MLYQRKPINPPSNAETNTTILQNPTCKIGYRHRGKVRLDRYGRVEVGQCHQIAARSDNLVVGPENTWGEEMIIKFGRKLNIYRKSAIKTYDNNFAKELILRKI